MEKERSNSVHLYNEFHKLLLNTMEREQLKITTVLNQLRLLKSKITLPEELFENVETNREELSRTFNTERSSWQSNVDEQQGSSKKSLDVDERKKLVEQGEKEQKTENESQINKLKAQIQEAEDALNEAKFEVENTKYMSDKRKLHALLHTLKVCDQIVRLSEVFEFSKQQHDFLIARVDGLDNERQIKEYKIQIVHLEQENRNLLKENGLHTIAKEHLSYEIQVLRRHIVNLTRQLAVEQVQPSTNTGPDKLRVESPIANKKHAVNMPQPVHKLDFLRARVDGLDNERQIKEYKIQIAHLEQENRNLLIENGLHTIAKERLYYKIQLLTRQLAVEQVQPSTNTGPDKLRVESPIANKKHAVNMPQPVHQPVTVNLLKSAVAEISIKQMKMDPRCVVVLPDNRTPSTSSQTEYETSTMDTDGDSQSTKNEEAHLIDLENLERILSRESEEEDVELESYNKKQLK